MPGAASATSPATAGSSMPERSDRMRRAREAALCMLACALVLAGMGCGGVGETQPPSAARGEPQSRVSIAFVGQALIKYDICKSAPASLAQARDSLRGADVAFTNLEVAIQPAGQNLPARSKEAVPAPPIVLDCLKAMGFNMLSLANNHAFDLRLAGMFATMDEVRQRGFAYAGTGADAAAATAPGFLETGKGRV